MHELRASAANVDIRIVLHSRPLNFRDEFSNFHVAQANGQIELRV